ncbi:MAG: LysM peptidoglycan-binding domain-containing protein [Bacteroidetes bacterium]|nr:LysM peptidoglycan-binding domain-containing protein [Bacteroidota bacterium]
MSKYFIFIILFLISTFCTNVSVSQETQDSTEIIIEPENPAVRSLDSLAALLRAKNFPDYKNNRIASTQFPKDFIPEYSDSIYKARIEEINQRTPMKFTYNYRVKSFINLYAKNRRELTERVLGLSELHFPYFEEQLDKYDLPLELKYIAVIESALNPVARSRAGATGIWQFMLGTGRMYGLQVNSLVDDRADVQKATVAACRHFRDLYNIYGDWFLALAAYNAGPGNVNRAIRRAGGVKDFWAISSYLPRETRNYVPAFIAVAYVMEFSDEHNLYPIPAPYSYHDIDTIHVKHMLSFKAVSEIVGVPYDHLRYLNPAFRKGLIPQNNKEAYILRIPKDYTGVFLTNEEKIYNHKSTEQLRHEEMVAKSSETTIHVVRSGEVLGSIARKYGTSVREIQQLNNLKGTTIRTGQKLIVKAPNPLSLPNINTDNNVHIVKSGESLGIVASKYKVSISDLKDWNNLTGNMIHPGQNLIVRRAAVASTSKVKNAEIQDSDVEIVFDDIIEEEDSDEMLDEENNYFLYIVKQGDTLLDIASRYENITVEDIIELNDIEDTEELLEGQTLKILLP